jgi:hypothetical protein
MNKTTLLLTWTIQPNNNLKQKSIVLDNGHFFNPKYREKEYISTILYYITNSNFDRFVFCENSWYKIKEWGNIEKIAKFYEKELELLQFIWDKENIIKYGYHYWEAEIFDYAFENSKFLKQTDKFFKVTWRYITYNINKLLDENKDQEYFFYKAHGLVSTLCVTTSFFMTTRNFYKKNLYKKQIKYYHDNYSNDKPFIPLEWVFYSLLKKQLFKDNKKIKDFPIFHFFTKKDIYLEDLKNKLWLLRYWKIWIIMDVLLNLIKWNKRFYSILDNNERKW